MCDFLMYHIGPLTSSRNDDDDDDDDDDSGGQSTTALVGEIIGSIMGMLIMICCITWYCYLYCHYS